MIYWIKAGDTGAVKVGYAVSVAKRFHNLQWASPYPLILLRSAEGDRATEAALHRLYAGKRVRAEWFLLDAQDVEIDLGTLTVKPPIRSLPLKSLAALRALAAGGTALHGMDLLRSKKGAMSETAQALGITRSACSQWRIVPAESVVKIEEATGLPRERLRPDLYAPPSTALTEAA